MSAVAKKMKDRRPNFDRNAAFHQGEANICGLGSKKRINGPTKLKSE